MGRGDKGYVWESRRCVADSLFCMCSICCMCFCMCSVACMYVSVCYVLCMYVLYSVYRYLMFLYVLYVFCMCSCMYVLYDVCVCVLCRSEWGEFLQTRGTSLLPDDAITLSFYTQGELKARADAIEVEGGGG